MRIVGETTTNGNLVSRGINCVVAISWGNINEMYLRNFATGMRIDQRILKYISKCVFVRRNILWRGGVREKEREVVSGVADIGEKELRWG